MATMKEVMKTYKEVTKGLEAEIEEQKVKQSGALLDKINEINKITLNAIKAEFMKAENSLYNQFKLADQAQMALKKEKTKLKLAEYDADGGDIMADIAKMKIMEAGEEAKFKANGSKLTPEVKTYSSLTEMYSQPLVAEAKKKANKLDGVKFIESINDGIQSGDLFLDQNIAPKGKWIGGYSDAPTWEKFTTPTPEYASDHFAYLGHPCSKGLFDYLTAHEPKSAMWHIVHDNCGCRWEVKMFVECVSPVMAYDPKAKLEAKPNDYTSTYKWALTIPCQQHDNSNPSM